MDNEQKAGEIYVLLEEECEKEISQIDCLGHEVSNSKGGVTYGIPVSAVTSCLYYNKDIFDQAGVEYPTDDWTMGRCRKSFERNSEESRKCKRIFIWNANSSIYI